MKILIFLVVTLFFICPSVFVSPDSVQNNAFSNWQFPFARLILALFALFLFYIYPKVYGQPEKKVSEKVNILGKFKVISTICLLFCSSFFFNFLSYVFPKAVNNSIDFSFPTTFITWIFCILNFLFAAFYEEVIYRLFFTDAFLSILKQINPVFEKKLSVVICEIIGCAVFAFGHYYLGIFAVANAAIAHFILRDTYKKSGSIIPGFIAHFIYNVTSLILL